MKSTGKIQSPYFRERNSFDSPQCSTVVQINPTWQTQQNMLSNVNFPQQQTNRVYYENEQIYKGALQQKDLNIEGKYEKMSDFNRKVVPQTKTMEPVFENKFMSFVDNGEDFNQKKYKQKIPYQQNKQTFSTTKHNHGSNSCEYSPRKRLYSTSSTNSLIKNKQIDSSRSNLLKGQYQSTQLQRDSSIQKVNYTYNPTMLLNDSQPSYIDEQKLKQIQQKIRKYQARGKSNTNQYKTQKSKGSFRDTIEGQMKKIQIDFQEPKSKLRKKQTIIDNISFDKQNFNYPSKKTNDKQLKNDKLFNDKQKFLSQNERNTIFDKLERQLARIYTLVTIDASQSLSVENMNLKMLSVDQIKIVLGPIFTEITIKNKHISKGQFIVKAFEILKDYKQSQIEGIIDILMSQSNPKPEIQIKKSQHLNRVPGKLISNSKVSIRNQNQKQHQQVQRKIMNHSKHLSYQSARENSYKQLSSRDKYDQAQMEMNKNVYIQPTESDQFFYNNRLRRQKLDTEKNLNEQALEIMLAEEKSKRYVSQQSEQKIVFNKNDEELERLNNLQKRFNEHFSSKK